MGINRLRRITKLSFFSLGVTLILFWMLYLQRDTEDLVQRPNILFIMSDDHTSQAWGVYGGILSEYVKNEHIRELTEDGVLLTNAFCTNSICVPSRASILSGRYSHRNGVYDLSGEYHPDSTNIAKVLQSNGYQTAIFGKWHLKSEPQGFDDYMVLPGQGRYIDPVLITRAEWGDEDNYRAYEGYSSDVITDFSIEWLEERETDKPFFLCTHFKATHEPFYYPERYKDFLADIELPYPSTLEEFGGEASGRTHDGWPLEILGDRYTAGTGDRYPGASFSLDGLDTMEARKKIYQKFVKDFLRTGAAIDDNIGRLIDYLKSVDQYDNTIIIYTADQGYFLGEHGFFDKRFIYEESLRMPTVIVYSDELDGNRKLDDIILNIDFPALLLDYAGGLEMDGMQGRSFRSNLNGKTPADWRKSMYYRYWSNQPERPAHLGIRNERYKLALFYGQSRLNQERDTMPYPPGWEFYDLLHDSEETSNRMDDPAYQDTIRALQAELQQLKTDLGDSEINPVIQDIFNEYW